MSIKYFRAVGVGIVLCGTVWTATGVSAYQKTQLTLSPSGDFVLEPGKTEIVINPGETTLRAITVTNRVGRTVAFSVATEDIQGTNSGTVAVTLLGDARGLYSLKDFIKPEIDSFELASGEKISIPVSISVPQNTSPGGYYGAIVIATSGENPADVSSGQTKIVSRIGSLFLVRVAGSVLESGHLGDFKALGPKQIFYQKSPDGFEFQFTNNGTVHLVPYGVIVIKNILGHVVDRIPVNAYFVLPSSSRYSQIEWGNQSFLLGRYTATLELYPGYGDPNLAIQPQSLSFWVLPWPAVAPLVIGVTVLAVIFVLLLTRFEVRRKHNLKLKI